MEILSFLKTLRKRVLARTLVFIDAEIGVEDQKIHDLGALREDQTCFHSGSVQDFLAFIADADYVCGHNILQHDLSYITRALGCKLQAESIECLNGGKDTLRIRVDGNLLPPCIEAEFSPAELAPGRLGELIVRFVPSEGRVPQRVPVVLKGLGLSPLQSSITVRIGADSDNTKQRE